MLFNLDFANNTILSCFVFFYLIIDLYFLIPAVIAQIFNPIGEHVIPIEIPCKKTITETEIHLVVVEANIKSVQYSLELHKPFCVFYPSIYFSLFLHRNNF